MKKRTTVPANLIVHISIQKINILENIFLRFLNLVHRQGLLTKDETSEETLRKHTFPPKVEEIPIPEIRELLRSIEAYDMRYFPQHVLLCTCTVHDQSANICIQGYLRILWIRNTKSTKID